MTVRRLESVHRLIYFRFCNVLHIWTIRAIPTYRVYRLYDIIIMVSVCLLTTIYTNHNHFDNTRITERAYTLLYCELNIKRTIIIIRKMYIQIPSN